MVEQISCIDKVSIVAIAKQIQKDEQTGTIADLARKLDVPIMSENRNRTSLIERITRPPEKFPAISGFLHAVSG